jgi:hypothetical protein
MSHKKIFPADISEFAAETLINRHSKTSQIIYTILLCAFVALIVSLFLISVDVNVQNQGVITTNEKNTNITIPV